MFRLREAILFIFYSISLGADIGCPSRLILDNADYKRSLRTTVGFDYMIGDFKFYNPIIPDDATDGLRKNMEQECTARLATQSLI